MRVLLTADGSKSTKKALAFLTTHESLVNSDNGLFVIDVLIPVPGRARTLLGSAKVTAHH